MERMELIRIDDPGYPPLLRQAANPPHTLYIRGDASLMGRTDAVAVVGTRGSTRYGQTATARIVNNLAAAGAPIISGLAIGIDAAAHEAALTAGGMTVAVLAAGVTDDDIGPRANYGLAQRILKCGGALISEKPPGTVAYKNMFLLRNRIVAGMSRATIVVEAAERSGALVTARLALETGRDVFSVPGPITSHASGGTNRLIADGAIPALSPDFVLATLGYATAGQGGREAALSETETDVLAAMRAGADTPDAVAEKTSLPVRVVLATIASLSIKGMQVPGAGN